MDICHSKMSRKVWYHIWIMTTLWSFMRTDAKEGQREVRGGEFCEFDTFEASCGPGEVVQMESAHYGRMRLGKCVLSDLGFVGCSADVLDLVDQRCSGKRKCSIRMPDQKIASRRPCMTELKMYLEANYTCIKVIGIERPSCNNCDYVKVTQPAGLIASTITRESGCGGANCPWLLEASSGQRIDISLINYGYSKTDSTCQVYATIKEVDSAMFKSPKTLCATRQRMEQVYTSHSHALELRIVTGQVTGRETTNKSEFLIQYSFIGCEELTAPDGGWVKRRGDVTTMGCNSSSNTWTLKCEESNWLGERHQCPGYGPQPSGSIQPGVNLPSGLSIVIIIAVAFVVGAFILCIGVIMFRKRYMARACPPESMYPPGKVMASPDVVKDPFYMPPLYSQGTRDYQERPFRSERENYTPIWERPLPNPVTDTSACSCPTGSSVSPGNRAQESEYNTLASVTDVIPTSVPNTRRGMVYGNNTMARKEYEMPSPDSDNDPRYFQVDPENM